MEIAFYCRVGGQSFGFVLPDDADKLREFFAEHQKHPTNPRMFPSPKTGGMYHPDSVVNIHKKILKDAGLEHLRFHDLRHPYVKPTTKFLACA